MSVVPTQTGKAGSSLSNGDFQTLGRAEGWACDHSRDAHSVCASTYQIHIEHSVTWKG